MADPTRYLGELMVHKASQKAGPIVRAAIAPDRPSIELTLKTFDGLCFKGEPSDFKPASGPECLTFVEGWLGGVPIGIY